MRCGPWAYPRVSGAALVELVDGTAYSGLPPRERGSRRLVHCAQRLAGPTPA